MLNGPLREIDTSQSRSGPREFSMVGTEADADFEHPFPLCFTEPCERQNFGF
jgi:hypothetical protein